MAVFKEGQTYIQDDTTLRIMAFKDSTALLEQWQGDTLVQYVVTHGLIAENDILHWTGSGEYFPCMYPSPACDAPHEALRKAMQRFVELTQPDTHTEFYLQIAYSFTESDLNDTVRFAMRKPSSEEKFNAAVEKAVAAYSGEEFEDIGYLDVTVDMLNAIASTLGAKWEYGHSAGVVEVDDMLGRTYRRT